MKKRNPGFLLILFLMFLAGCAVFSSDKKEYFPAAWLGAEKPSPRAAPAQVSRETEEALKKKGFVAIGQISEKVVTGTYWGSTRSPDKPESRDVTTGLLRRAADRGGDLVVLRKNNSAESLSVTRQGRATSWRQESRTELYQVHRYTGDAGYQASRTVTYSVPTSWETVYGTEYSVVSSGTVWRHDPELEIRSREKLAAIQKEQAIQQREQAERQKELAEQNKELPIIRREKEELSARIAAYKKANEERGLMSQNEELVSVKIGGKYGFQDRNGNTIIEPRFSDSMWGFSEGVAVVSVGAKDEKKWGIIDKAGKWVLQPSYKTMGKPSNGMVLIYEKDRCGYVNTKGEVVIAAQFETCWGFSEGMSAVRQGKKGKVGYIDKSGKIVIEPKFDLGGPFSERVAAVLVGGKYGYIDAQGKYIIKPRFRDAEPFIKGIARVKDGLTEKYITKAGEVLTAR